MVITEMEMLVGMSGLGLARHLTKGAPGLKMVISSRYRADLVDKGLTKDAAIVGRCLTN